MLSSWETLSTDFLVIGSGVAGLRAAVELSKGGEVLVVTKDVVTESSSEYAQGGVAVALSDEDEVGIHFEDTIRAGDGLCREEAVRVLVGEGPERIMELIQWGAEFDRVGSKLDFAIEGAHSRRRVLHAHGDSTGQEIVRVLIEKIKTLRGVKRMPYSMAVDLYVQDGVCGGAIVLRPTGICLIRAKATVLATGGAGQVYARTTNPSVATSDGVGMAFRAGAVVEDMEFVQFHPTALYMEGAPQFLLSEAMRGEGGVLRNIHGEAFMKRYHPDGDLAPRDVVSRAIISEMVRTKSSHVYLDMTHLDAQFLKRRFPRIYRTCLQCGVDITSQKIPVSPAAHYIMGGVKTDIDGRTTIRGLYAAGETACTGVHGANRLASNSLLEGLVFGARAGVAALEEAGRALSHIREIPRHLLEGIGEISGQESLRDEVRRVMWERVGIIRCRESLQIARDFLREHAYITEKQYLRREELELKNILTTAMLITESAMRRECSIGAHYRSDYKQREGCLYHQAVVLRGDRMEFYRS